MKKRDAKRYEIVLGNGRLVDPIDTSTVEIDLVTIAKSLANQGRWTGHTKRFYSVAQHCVIGSYYVPPEDALTFLFHDATEALVADIAMPLKRRVFFHVEDEVKSVDAVEEALWRDVIAPKFGLPDSLPDSVREADRRMAVTEAVWVLPRNEWDLTSLGIDPYEDRIVPLPPEAAFLQFIYRYAELTGDLPKIDLRGL